MLNKNAKVILDNILHVDTNIQYEMAERIASNIGYKLVPENNNTKPAASPVEVKGLEWVELTQARSDEDPHREVVGWEAHSGFNTYYTIDINPGDYGLMFDHHDFGRFASEDDAKAAAQAHRDQCVQSVLVRSALSVSPVPASGEALSVKDERYNCPGPITSSNDIK